MNVEVFALCDAATVEGGKLNILGVFDSIWALTLPAAHPQCAIAIRIRFENIERGEHRIMVNIVDLDGRHIVPSANATINLDFPQEQRSGSTNLIFNLHMLKLERYGEYSIDLAIDNRKEASLPLFVKPSP